jgi:simple sugar transport system ATP-binding protein
MRVWENVLLGREPRRGFALDKRGARARVRELGERHGLEVDPDAIVETLPVGLQQRVELLRELEREPAVLLLDEPTATLAPAETAALFATLTRLAQSGVAILIITHKLADVVRFTARVTVMRRGKIVERLETANASLEGIARAMVGGALPAVAARSATVPRPCLTLRGFSTPGRPFAARDVELEVRAGEIVGIAGIEGNGQTALADAIAGIIRHEGSMTLDADVRLIPQDRLNEAVVPNWSVTDNVALGRQRSRYRRGLAFDRRTARADAAEIAERFDVRPRALDAPLVTFSGGNQQKIVVGRALAGEPRFVLAYQPTRGIDVGAAALVQSRLIEARNAGCAILLISFDLDEIFALADRIGVMYGGRLGPLVERDAADRAAIGARMAGSA